MQKKAIIVSIVFSFFVFAGFGCKEELATFDTTLSVWGVFDNESDYREVFNSYVGSHPFVSDINYRKFTVDTYKDDLLNALAAGNNPDIFMIHNTWLPEFADKIAPAPEGMMDPALITPKLADVATRDMIFGGQMFALTPTVDSLALYYNKDIFNAAGITSPPKTWNEFDDVVKQLTQIDDNGRITRSGATLGTAQNISRPEDILTVLMMQGGAEMVRNGSVHFDKGIDSGNGIINPGRDALLYYTSFARGTSPVYTWNNAQHYSIDAFFQGTAAMTISYSYSYDTIKAKNEKLNFAVAPLPQIDGESLGQQANFANYWMFVVAKNHKLDPPKQGQTFQVNNRMKIWESWQFLRVFALHPGGEIELRSPLDNSTYTTLFPIDLAKRYLEITNKPPLRKDLIELQKDDLRMGSFARGNLIARTWLRDNADQVDDVFAEMIDSVNKGLSVEKALEAGAGKTGQLIRTR